MTTYDAIVVGSGVGGLAAASLLTHVGGWRVLVLERHFALGGFNHAFQRKGFHWDIGLHYVGDMAPGSQLRRIMDLVTRGEVDWRRMPDEFDVFHYPDEQFAAPSDADEYADRLCARFPAEASAIRAYFADVRRASGWFAREVVRWNIPRPASAALGWALRRDRALALTTTGTYLGSRFADPALRAALASQWGDYALPPRDSAFAMHALIVDHYLRGGWYPVGGSTAMTAAMVGVIRDGGGDAQVYSTVEEILIENGSAAGVRVAVKRGRASRVHEVRAPVVISDAGARATVGRLVSRSMPQERLLAAHPSGTACVTAYLGLARSPEELGFHGENHWYFTSLDHDAAAASDGALRGEPGHAYLSFPSLKDPGATRHTAEIITTVPAAAFAAWSGTSWQRRGDDYDQLKRRIGDGLVHFVETRAPGFRALVEHVEVSTPLTVSQFAGYPSGSFADLAGTPDRLRHKMFPSRIGPGLYLTGADAMSLGIAGALMGAVMAAGSAMGPLGIPRVMARAARRRPPGVA